GCPAFPHPYTQSDGCRLRSVRCVESIRRSLPPTAPAGKEFACRILPPTGGSVPGERPGERSPVRRSPYSCESLRTLPSRNAERAWRAAPCSPPTAQIRRSSTSTGCFQMPFWCPLLLKLRWNNCWRKRRIRKYNMLRDIELILCLVKYN